MAKAKTLSSTGAAASLPQGNAIVTVNGNGQLTAVKGEVLPPSTVKSKVTPDIDTGWLRVAECVGSPFFGLISIVGSYNQTHGDGYPAVIAIGAGSCVTKAYVKDRIAPVVNLSTVTKVRIVESGNKTLYVDLQFRRGGGTPTIGLIGSYGINLLTPSIAPTDVDVDEATSLIYELS